MCNRSDARPGIDEPIAIPGLSQLVLFLPAMTMTLEEKVMGETGMLPAGSSMV
jgi:hypothetical protein